MNCLSRINVRILDDHTDGASISLLIDAPPSAIAQLALSFPAPPGSPPLWIHPSGSHVLQDALQDELSTVAAVIQSSSRSLEKQDAPKLLLRDIEC